MKATQWITGFIAFAIIAAHGASAQTAGTLINSGDHVDLSQNTSSETRVDVTNRNDATVNQSADAHISTGGNSSDRNISFGGPAGGVVSGNAMFGAAFGASANDTATLINVPTQRSGSGTLDIINTGDHVGARTDSSNVTDVSVNNNNSAWIDQAATMHANTGGNTAERNIGGGSVHSGNVGFAADFSANANKNLTALSIGGVGSYFPAQRNSLGLINTGDRVNASSNESNRHSVSISNWNELWLNQSAKTHVSTGKNNADRGIGGGYVKSGDVDSLAFFDAGHVNSSMTAVDATPWGSYLFGMGGRAW